MTRAEQDVLVWSPDAALMDTVAHLLDMEEMRAGSRCHHLEGDALNVAILVPESRWATRVGLVGAPRDFDEWCAWNDVDEEEGYYAPCSPDVMDRIGFPGTACHRDADTVVVSSVGCTNILELPDFSGDCYEFYGGGGGG